ncbi:hypothetical protein yc1106_01245 [Curvularia clavata]|uniref:Uncharacterized protein n=1 Tax=Curvularia clavata TaxID=95742 RepID=A0A9Q9DQ38_CURCL|nr:hypothetical protein yc1106_01245 [Curvularia clavata]
MDLPSIAVWMDPASMNAFIEAVSRPTSQAPSRHHSPDLCVTIPDRDSNVAIHLPGSGHLRTAPQEELPPSIALAFTPSPSPTFYIPLSTRGRPRAASRALNQAYNAANVSVGVTPSIASSPIAASTHHTMHGQPYDHDTAAELRTKLCLQMTPGSQVQQVPLMKCADGRVIIDWVVLKNQEMKRMSGKVV